MRRRQALAAGVGVAASLSLVGCTLGGGPSTPERLRFRPTAFDSGGTVPDRFTCEAADGSGISPPFAVESLPAPTEAVALVVEYPNSVGGTFTHWVLWNVPPDVTVIPAGLPTDPTLPSLGGARQGRNGTDRVGYVGLCPPPTDEPQEYWVTLYALRRELDVPAGASRDPFDDAVETATLASRRLVARFGRPVPDDGGTPTGRRSPDARPPDPAFDLGVRGPARARPFLAEHHDYFSRAPAGSMGFHTFDVSRADRLERESRYRYVSVDELLALFDPEGAVVADLGSGTGFYTDDVAPYAERVYAVDLQPAMHEVYREKGVPENVEFVTAELSDLPFDDGSLDAAFSTMTFHEFASETALSEVARVLVDGGRLGVADWTARGLGEAGPPRDERYDLATAVEMAEAAGLTVEHASERRETFVFRAVS